MKLFFESLLSSQYAFDEVYSLIYKPLYESIIAHCCYLSRDSLIGNDPDTTLLSLLFEALHEVFSTLLFHCRLIQSSQTQLPSSKHSLLMNLFSCLRRF